MVNFLARRKLFFLPTVILSSAYAYTIREGGSADDPGLSRYVSRPDLAAPQWDVRVYHQDLVSTGYWFVAPYKTLDQDQAERSWVGPHIYDGKTGELVWSGSTSFEFNSSNVEDFRLSNVNGEYKMTLMSQMLGQGFIMDSNYKIVNRVHLDERVKNANTHEFNFVDGGSRVLVLKNHAQRATQEMSEVVGFDGECRCGFDGFEELDTSNWNSVFQFYSYGKIGLDESTMTDWGDVDERCRGRWDFIHANSVDKTPEGDYILSARHTDTIYKVSGEDGEIIWRLGGLKSDFPIDEEWRFSRQHDVRFRGQNDSHILLSMLDNAVGRDDQPPTYDFSRGLLVAIDEKNRQVTLQKRFDHPLGHGHYAPRRGNYQVLDNGNVFIGWSERAIQSEHTPDGQPVMVARFKTDWLGTYRNYKFPFVGHPIEPPVAVSQAYLTSSNYTRTKVYVSWNGATEIRTWNLYRTVANGQIDDHISTVGKTGFETEISCDGLVSYIVVEALNEHGDILGRTSIVKTFVHENVTTEAIIEEEKWQENEHDGLQLKARLSHPITAFVFGLLCSSLALILWNWKHYGALNRMKGYASLHPTGLRYYDRIP